ncbi:hypothetical protein [Streptomyces alanosinicus]|uniref:Uncharacterized protein n=1 Tax=Streptomyces alanosinicus TaxID=68171 RepID=A0A918IQ57_9ACTN|nr:hypothetical protein [Streptomyces alanosinicus]GGW25493.1 hypothetical protein GCM10010339_94910 [Streptomyces alanosinicus]
MDFDHTFPALIARTLSELTGDERHVLRSAGLLDAFDPDLATQAAGLTHQSAARRLIERSMISEDPYAIWPYHLHGAIRAALRTADDHTEDQWTPADRHQAAERALAALGRQWQNARADTPVPSRALLVACLRQGLRLAADHHLDDLNWLADAAYAYAYTEDSVWEPVAPPAALHAPDANQQEPDTSADALAELLDAIARRQHQHRERTAGRLIKCWPRACCSARSLALPSTTAPRPTRTSDSPTTPCTACARSPTPAAGSAPLARGGLANLARIRGDFPTALAAILTLGWKGRHHSILGHIRWPHGDIDRVVAAFEAAWTEAEQHGAAGQRAVAQTLLALVTAFADPDRADEELALVSRDPVRVSSHCC